MYKLLLHWVTPSMFKVVPNLLNRMAYAWKPHSTIPNNLKNIDSHYKSSLPLSLSWRWFPLLQGNIMSLRSYPFHEISVDLASILTALPLCMDAPQEITERQGSPWHRDLPTAAEEKARGRTELGLQRLKQNSLTSKPEWGVKQPGLGNLQAQHSECLK